MAKTKILVLGASGYVGSRLVAALLAEGYLVRAAARKITTLKKRPWAGSCSVELRAVDVLNQKNLKHACAGCDVIYYLVHSMNPEHPDFAAADRQAATNLIRVMAKKTQRIIYLGSLGGKDAQSPHLHSRAEVASILSAGKAPLTFFRASVIIGTGSASFELVRHAVDKVPVIIAPSWLATKVQPIAIENVIGYLVGCLRKPSTAGKTFDIGGSDVITYRELMLTYAHAANLLRSVIQIPFLPSRPGSFLLRLVTPMPPTLFQPLVRSLPYDVICTEHAIRKLIPQKLLTVDEAIRKAIEPEIKKGTSSYSSYAQRYSGDPIWVGMN